MHSLGNEDRGKMPVVTVRQFLGLLKETYWAWSEDRAQRLGAALAYYTVFSLAPLLVIVIGMVGFVLGPGSAEEVVVSQMEGYLGTEGAAAIERIIKNVDVPTSSAAASLLGILTLFLGASGVVSELQASLNQIWDARPKRSGVRTFVRNRFMSLAFVLALGFLLLVSLVLGAFTSAVGRSLNLRLPIPPSLAQVFNSGVSFAVITTLFALIYKLLPDVRIAWRDVWLGSVVTAVLFTAANVLLGIYLGRAAIGTVYGAAGSIVLILLWSYYCAQILYFGAEFTHVYARAFGSKKEETAPAGAVS